MSLNSKQPLPSTLATNLAQLKKLSKKDSSEHTAEISSILLWIAENHPEKFEGNAKELRSVYVKRLYFHKSWEFPDELVPTNVLKTLLRIYDIKDLCGYMDHCVLEHIDKKPLNQIRLALGKHINVRLLIEELNCRRIRHLRKKNLELLEDDIAIHLRCGELDLKDLAPLPNNEPKLYISDVSDQDVAWVVQAAIALRPKPAPDKLELPHMQEPYFGALKLPRSNLTLAGIEALVKGLSDVYVIAEEIQVSSPHLPHLDEDEDEEIPGYEDPSDFCMMLSDKYYKPKDIDCIVNFDDDKGLEFTVFPEKKRSLDDLEYDSDDKYMHGWGTYGSELQVW